MRQWAVTTIAAIGVLLIFVQTLTFFENQTDSVAALWLHITAVALAALALRQPSPLLRALVLLSLPIEFVAAIMVEMDDAGVGFIGAILSITATWLPVNNGAPSGLPSIAK